MKHLSGLPQPAPRHHRHDRQIHCQGFAREDGLLDIEAELIDTKSYDFPSDTHGTVKTGTPIHHMQVRITLNFDLEITDAVAVTLHGPYLVCPKGAENIKNLIGLQIGPGWRNKTKAAIGGPKGCTHITELLGQMATTAFQTLYGEKARLKREAQLNSPQDQTRNQTPIQTPLPSLRNSCIAYAED